MSDQERIIVTPEYLASQGLNSTFPDRFWAKVDKTSSPHGCWLWTASTTINRGFIRGTINRGGRGPNIIASRAAWILCRGPIPESKQVLHDCPGGDNPLCMNPAHLWLGNQAENVQDSVTKGRMNIGEMQGAHKLTWEQVCAIRAATGTHESIAESFGVSRRLIGMIRNFERWNHPMLFNHELRENLAA